MAARVQRSRKKTVHFDPSLVGGKGVQGDSGAKKGKGTRAGKRCAGGKRGNDGAGGVQTEEERLAAELSDPYSLFTNSPCPFAGMCDCWRESVCGRAGVCLCVCVYTE